MCFHNSEHKESDGRKTKNLIVQNTDPTDHCNQAPALARVINKMSVASELQWQEIFPTGKLEFVLTQLLLLGELCQCQ